MLNRLNNFKHLLGEERNLSEQIIKAHEIINSLQNENEINMIDATNNYLL
jgi:hypothetical protein